LTLNILFSTNIEELLVKGLRNHFTSIFYNKLTILNLPKLFNNIGFIT